MIRDRALRDLDMPDRRLQALQAVARHRSFTKAADALCMTQPAVTFQIKQLEDQFNTRLFDRVGGRITLTPAGAVALDYAERILALSAELDAKMKEVTGREVGPLTIGASTTIAEFLLPRIVGEFKSLHASIVPQLVVANSEVVQARVAERSLDLGFIEGDSHLRTLATEVCCDDELQVVCAPTHPLARHSSLQLSSLSEYPYISRELGSGTREVIDRYLQKAGLPPDALQIVMEASSPEALKGLVVTGVGFAIMSHGGEGSSSGRTRPDSTDAAAAPAALRGVSTRAHSIQDRQRLHPVCQATHGAAPELPSAGAGKRTRPDTRTRLSQRAEWPLNLTGTFSSAASEA
jgi:DNA-binding transcriptional LysR family regulator